MNYLHKEMANGRWAKFSLSEQMANIGSEVERTISWKEKDPATSRRAFERALELIDLSLECQKTLPRRKELARVREVLVDYFVYDNSYGSTDQSWRKYFYAFNYAARTNH